MKNYFGVMCSAVLIGSSFAYIFPQKTDVLPSYDLSAIF